MKNKIQEKIMGLVSGMCIGVLTVVFCLTLGELAPLDLRMIILAL